jgi:nucleoside-diphosphate-sugar epimerase
MRHVIVGGSGFTGGFLAQQLLEQGEDVVIVDLAPPQDSALGHRAFLPVDITDTRALANLMLEPEDVVYHLAARQYHKRIPRFGRSGFFNSVNVAGTRNILERMERSGCPNMVYFSTDMVYGLPDAIPVQTNHPRRPLGPYGKSKAAAEEICAAARLRGFKITVFRPRLIVGPGRLGIFAKLFRLIAANLPVPLIGDGSNQYQMISVFDCVDAMRCAVRRGLPNEEYNLGSISPPTSRQLLENLIERVGSRSYLIGTPGSLVKAFLATLDYAALTLLYPEQFLIADLNYLVDISKTERQLGWIPRFRDEDMLYQAYLEYSNGSVGKHLRSDRQLKKARLRS